MQMGFPSLAEDTDFNSSAQQRRVTKSSPVSAPRNKAPDQVKLPLTEMFENYLLNESVMAGYGNLVAIYDLLPRFYGWKKRTDFGDGLCTEFTGSIKGNLFHVQMTAAAIQKRIRIKEESQGQPLEEAQEIIPISTRTRSETVLMYPGMREELVEDALRKFSVIGNGFVDGSQRRRTLNHAAYSAGTKKIVSSVATLRPPMIAIAIGPQNTLRVSGIIANTVASAVSITGRARWMAASNIAPHTSSPSAISTCT